MTPLNPQLDTLGLSLAPNGTGFNWEDTGRRIFAVLWDQHRGGLIFCTILAKTEQKSPRSRFPPPRKKTPHGAFDNVTQSKYAAKTLQLPPKPPQRPSRAALRGLPRWN